MAEPRSKLLPSWWAAEKAVECEVYGAGDGDGDGEGRSSLRRAMEKAEIVTGCGNPLMPLQLRMLGETIYERNPTGHSGAVTRQVIMQQESGVPVGQSVSYTDLSAAFRR